MFGGYFFLFIIHGLGSFQNLRTVSFMNSENFSFRSIQVLVPSSISLNFCFIFSTALSLCAGFFISSSDICPAHEYSLELCYSDI